MNNRQTDTSEMLAIIDVIMQWVEQLESSANGLDQMELEWTGSAGTKALGESLTTLIHAVQSRVRKEIVQHATSVKVIGKLAADIANLAPLQEVLQRICETSRYLLGSDICYIALLNEAQDAIVVQAGSGVSQALIGVRQRLGQGIGGRVILTKRHTVFTNYRAELRRDPEVENAIDRERIISAVAVPMIRGDHAIGVLYTAMRTIHEYGAQEVDLATNLATLASVAIHNAALYDETMWLMKINHEFAQVGLSDNALDQICITLGKLTKSRVSVFDSRLLPIAMGNRTVFQAEEAVEPLKQFFSTKVTHDYHFLTSRNGPGIVSRIGSTRGIPAVIVMAKEDCPESFSQADFRAIERAKILLELGLNQMRLRHELHVTATSVFLHNVVTGPGPSQLLAEQARQLDLNSPDDYQLLVTFVGEPREARSHQEDMNKLVNDARTLLQHSSIIASTVEENSLIVLVHRETATKAANDLHEIVGKVVTPYPLWVAISETCSNWDGYAREWHNCVTALQWHMKIRPDIPVITSQTYGLISILFDASNIEQIDRFCCATLGPLSAYDKSYGSDLVRTLLSYLDHECELRSTALSLTIHYNTLRYRLHQIEDILNVHLNDQSMRQQLRLALWCNEAFGFLESTEF